MAAKCVTHCVLVGPPESGKTSLLVNLTTGEPTDASMLHVPTIFEKYTTIIEQNGKEHELRSAVIVGYLWSSWPTFIPRLQDTGADPELRASGFPGADVVLLCFPATDLTLMDKEGLRSSLQVYTDETSKLAPEKQPCVILVGTKTDLKEAKKDSGQGCCCKNIYSEIMMTFRSRLGFGSRSWCTGVPWMFSSSEPCWSQRTLQKSHQYTGGDWR